jgi:hypothetical protein
MKSSIASIFLFTLLFLHDSAWSQITIIETPNTDVISTYKMGLPGGRWTELELTRKIVDTDTSFVLMYKNHEYSTILDYQSIQIPNSEALLQFRDVIMSVFTPPNDKNRDYEVSFKLGDDISPNNALITVKSMRSMGTFSV